MCLSDIQVVSRWGFNQGNYNKFPSTISYTKAFSSKDQLFKQWGSDLSEDPVIIKNIKLQMYEKSESVLRGVGTSNHQYMDESNGEPNFARHSERIVIDILEQAFKYVVENLDHKLFPSVRKRLPVDIVATIPTV